MNTRYQVFISATYEDLKEERIEVFQNILKMGHIPITMEYFTGGGTVWSRIEKYIKECDYFILIIGGRYGSTDSYRSYKNLSFTEIEYKIANEANIPIIPCVRKNYKEHHTYTHYENSQTKMDAFVASLRQAMIAYWTEKGNIGGEVVSSLKGMIDDHPRLGWRKNLSPEPSKEEAKEYYYLCYYYLFAKHKVETFKLSVFIENNNDETPIIKAKEVGIHDYGTSLSYEGFGTSYSSYVCLTLKSKKRKDALNLVMIADINSLDDTEVIFGSYQGCTAGGNAHIISGEFIAVKCDSSFEEGKITIDKPSLLRIKQLTMINRQMLRVHSRNINETDLVCKHLEFQKLLHLVGHYLVLIPREKGKPSFIISRLEIKEDFSAYLYTGRMLKNSTKFPEEQICIIRSSGFSNKNSEKLHLTMYEKRKVRVLSSAIIDFPDELEINKVLVGNYCNIGPPVHQDDDSLRVKSGARSGYLFVRFLGKANLEEVPEKYNEIINTKLGEFEEKTLEAMVDGSRNHKDNNIASLSLVELLCEAKLHYP